MLFRSKKLLVLILVGILALPAFADGRVLVRSVVYEVDGRTIPYFLAQKTELPEGMEFSSISDLETYLARARQRLLNERVLESVEVELGFGPIGGDGKLPADITFRVKDTWNIIVLPYFKFDSNSGLLVSGRARDYNFLGSMLPLRIDANYEKNFGEDGIWSLDLDFSYPFPALDMDWSFDLSASIELHAEGSSPSAMMGLGISSFLPLGPGTLDLGLGQKFLFNAWESSTSEYEDKFFMISNSYVGYTYPLWVSPDGERLNIRPRVGVTGNWDIGGVEDYRLQGSPTLQAGTDLSYGTVNWQGNFRDGWRANLDVSLDYSVFHHNYTRSFTLASSRFDDFGWFGLGMRFKAFYLFDGADDTAGSELRGILNKRAVTDAAYVVNLDLPIRLIKFRPSDWFNKRWMRLFDFDQHWVPFFDMSQGHYDDTWFLMTKGWYGAGLEVITFPAVMRSLFVRISIGVDLIDVLSSRSLTGRSARDGEATREIFFGLGHHY